MTSKFKIFTSLLLKGPVAIDSYLEGVLDAVSRLTDPDSLQHTGISELPQNQAVVEAQRKLRGNEEGRVNTVQH